MRYYTYPIDSLEEYLFFKHCNITPVTLSLEFMRDFVYDIVVQKRDATAFKDYEGYWLTDNIFASIFNDVMGELYIGNKVLEASYTRMFIPYSKFKKVLEDINLELIEQRLREHLELTLSEYDKVPVSAIVIRSFNPYFHVLYIGEPKDGKTVELQHSPNRKLLTKLWAEYI